MAFTELQIKRLKPKVESYDKTETGVSSDRRGLQIRVFPTGSKTWRFRYMYNGKTQRITLGNFPEMGLEDAHKAQQECRALLRAGINPVHRKKIQLRNERDAPSIQLLYEDFRDHYLRKKRKRPEQAEQAMEKHIIPHWGDFKAKEVTRRDIIERIREIEEAGAARMAEVVKAIVSQMFRHGVDVGLLETSPAVALPTIGSRGGKRERILTESEIKRFWKKLDDAKLHELTKLAYRFLLATGQRRGEVALARWDDIDRDTATWTIPAEHSKNGKPHDVPLSKLALTILDDIDAELRDEDTGEITSEWLLPSPTRAGRSMDPRALSRGIRNNEKHFKIVRFNCHDLRRTVASQMTALGIPRLHVSKVLNHADTGITAVYDNHDYADEKRQALETWGKRLKKIITGKASKVTPLRKRA